MLNKEKLRRYPGGFQVVLTRVSAKIMIFRRIIPKANRRKRAGFIIDKFFWRDIIKKDYPKRERLWKLKWTKYT